MQCDDHQQVHGVLASTKPLFCPISPYGRVAQKISDDNIIGLIHKNQPNLYQVTLRVQRNFKYGRPRKLLVTIITFFYKMVTNVCEGNHQDLNENFQNAQPQGYRWQ